MSETSEPPVKDHIAVDHHRVFCSLHGEPFRAAWPKGYMIAALEMMKAVVELDGVPDPAKPREVEAWLDEKPGCCRVTRGQLHGIYIRCGVGVRRRCDVCHERGLGTPYKTTQKEWAHVCFGCVCTRFSTTPWGAS